MKNIDRYGVEALNIDEMKNIEGGFIVTASLVLMLDMFAYPLAITGRFLYNLFNLSVV